MQHEPLAVGCVYHTPERSVSAWAAPRSALGVVLSKEPPALTRQDVLVLACDALVHCVHWCKGHSEVSQTAGLDEIDYLFNIIFGACPHMPTQAPTDVRNLKILALALQILREPEGVCGMEVAGVWALLFLVISQRPAVCREALRTGLSELAMATLNKSTATEWVRYRTDAGIQAGMVAVAFAQTVATKTVGYEELGACGFVAATGLMLEELEQLGESQLAEANVATIVHAVCVVSPVFVDITLPEAAPILAILQGLRPSALRFSLDHNLKHIGAIGLNLAPLMGLAAAVIYGKEEEGVFAFTQEIVDDFLSFVSAILSGNAAPFIELTGSFLMPVVNLCISDLNKSLMVRSSGLLPLLLDALLLNPGHVRAERDSEEVKAAIQADAAHCFMQIALYGPGRELLAGADAVLSALRALAAGEARSENAQLSAEGALVAIEGKKAATSGTGGGSLVATKDHVMASYQWSYQDTIERIVRSLQDRGYRGQQTSLA
eukprot:COSAG05_NODE_1097_length_5894_cov_2.299741_4_plen_492_part_00